MQKEGYTVLDQSKTSYEQSNYTDPHFQRKMFQEYNLNKSDALLK